jgi:GTP-binding protein YchF
MRIGLFGFPMTGKSTLFHLLTGAPLPAYRTGRGEAQLAVSKVPDPRLFRLAELHKPKKTTPATIEYLDLPSMEKGHAMDVLPLEELRTVDALAHVVRAFEDDSIPHTEGAIDPARDVATMETEFLLADHTIAERRVEKLDLLVRKTNRDEHKKELELMRKVLSELEQGTPLRNVDFTDDEAFRLKGFTFLSLKPLLIVVNAGEADLTHLEQGPRAFGLEEFAGHPSTEVMALSAKIESEIAELDVDERTAFMEDLGIHEAALDRVIHASYRLLGYLSFFTVGDSECRAWTIPRGTNARTAGSAIHSDIERGFIRAEVVSYDDLIEVGHWNACRDKGKLRLEGKDYVVRDGDAIVFRFNV